jgi:hypothetical protein
VSIDRLLRDYAFLIESNPLWLYNWPGVDNRKVVDARRRQLAGQHWQLSELLPIRVIPLDTAAPNSAGLAA